MAFHSIQRRLCLGFLLLAASCVPHEAARAPQAPASEGPPLIAPAESSTAIGEIPPKTPVVKVALLLPLSGESVSIGNAMLDAGTLALYDNYLSVPSTQIHSQVILLPKDTGTTPDDAARVAKQAIEQGATFIIGPLFSQSVAAVAPIARAAHVNILTFSNTESVAAPGTFLFGFMPDQQVMRIGEYAFLHHLTRVALLAPNDSYGQKVKQTLSSLYGQKGGVVEPVELYAQNPANIDAAVARLATFNSTSPQHIQAIFIADSGPMLKNIIASIKKTNIDLKQVKLLGTGLWDDPEIAKIPEMNGAWFSSSPPDSYQSFARRFTTTYGYQPVRLASLAYDAVTIAAGLTMPSAGGAITDAMLADPRGFTGPANGLIRLKPNGTSQRALAILEVTPSGFKVIDPAPLGFEH